MTSLFPALPGITFTTVLLVVARAFTRLHFSFRGAPEGLWAVTNLLSNLALSRAEMSSDAVTCEACGAAERLPGHIPRMDYVRAQRVKVRVSPRAKALPQA